MYNISRPLISRWKASVSREPAFRDKMTKEIFYSDKYFDDEYEYRWVPFAKWKYKVRNITMVNCAFSYAHRAHIEHVISHDISHQQALKDTRSSTKQVFFIPHIRRLRTQWLNNIVVSRPHHLIVRNSFATEWTRIFGLFFFHASFFFLQRKEFIDKMTFLLVPPNVFVNFIEFDVFNGGIWY